MKHIILACCFFLRLLSSANDVILINYIADKENVILYKNIINPIEVKSLSSDSFEYLLKSNNSTINSSGIRNCFTVFCKLDTASLDLYKISKSDTIYIKSMKILVIDKYPLPTIYLGFSTNDTIYFDTILNKRVDYDSDFVECEICIKEKLHTTALHYQLKSYYLLVFREDSILFNKRLDLTNSIILTLKNLNIENGDKLLLYNIIGHIQEQKGRPNIYFQPIQYVIAFSSY